MLAFPGSKINVGLRVVAKREDGYHDIESVFLPTSFTDVLEAVKSAASTTTLVNTGIVVDGPKEDNLVLKAYYLLANHFDLPSLSFHLHKVIPTGTGLGGGSADGAAALKLINALCGLQLSKQQLCDFALQLGSDCPFFIEPQASYVSGRGEALQPIDLDLSNYKLAIVCPGFHVSTKQAYAGITPRPSKDDLKALLTKPITTWKEHVDNHFEPVVAGIHPALLDIKDKLYNMGAHYASMTGSGSAIYAFFDRATKIDTSTLKEAMVWVAPS